MNIYLDSYYKIGSTHQVCEDYALTGTHKDMSFAIVSDGCSACEDVDLGARLLTNIAKEALKEFYDEGHLTEGKMHISKDSLRNDIVEQIYVYSDIMNLDPLAFSATLLMAVHIKNGVSFFLGWGDGYFIERRPTETYIHKVEFESSAPFYLNYYPDPNNFKDNIAIYESLSRHNRAVVTEYLSLGGSSPKMVLEQHKRPTGFHFFKIVEPGERFHLSVISDGAGTFKRNSECIEESSADSLDTNLLMDLTEFRKTKKYFTEKSYIRYMNENNIPNMLEVKHTDDLSLATIMVGGVIRYKKPIN